MSVSRKVEDKIANTVGFMLSKIDLELMELHFHASINTNTVIDRLNGLQLLVVNKQGKDG